MDQEKSVFGVVVVCRWLFVINGIFLPVTNRCVYVVCLLIPGLDI